MPKTEPFLIYILEDDEWYAELLQYTLTLNPDYEAEVFHTGQELMETLKKQKPNVVTLDYLLPDMSGIDVLKKIKQTDENIEVIIISEQEEVETAVELLREGAYDYLVKEPDIRDRLLKVVDNIRKTHGLKERVQELEEEVKGKYDKHKAIIGESEAIQKVFALIEKASKTNINVIVTGETGTGKELVAKSIHYSSTFSKGPFVPVNMAAIPGDLAESELFGHEKGAFTGAVARRKGKFEEADQGTIFLDEIGELEMPMQAKLLRVLQEREVARVGGNEFIPLNCRVVVATNRNLAQMVKEGKFREDLYYRLQGLPIHLPPLRDRGKDVIIMAETFIRDFCRENGMSEKWLADTAKDKLLQYHFPGNVRELKSVVELSVVMANGDEITVQDIMLPEPVRDKPLDGHDLTLREYSRHLIKKYLDKYDNDVKKVAAKLDIGKSTIYNMLKEEEN